MSHDYELSITADDDTVFRFRTWDGDGKMTHSRPYITPHTANMYELQGWLVDAGMNITRQEANALKRTIRKQLEATPA